jgi:hypothetical protein
MAQNKKEFRKIILTHQKLRKPNGIRQSSPSLYQFPQPSWFWIPFIIQNKPETIYSEFSPNLATILLLADKIPTFSSLSSNLKMEAAGSSETLVPSTKTTRRHVLGAVISFITAKTQNLTCLTEVRNLSNRSRLRRIQHANYILITFIF